MAQSSVDCAQLNEGGNGTSFGDSQSCETGLPLLSPEAGVDTVLQIAFGVIAAIAVIIILIAAINFATSEGDPQKAAKARGTIIFAAVGLMVALLAEAIVVFVIGNL